MSSPGRPRFPGWIVAATATLPPLAFGCWSVVRYLRARGEAQQSAEACVALHSQISALQLALADSNRARGQAEARVAELEDKVAELTEEIERLRERDVACAPAQWAPAQPPPAAAVEDEAPRAEYPLGPHEGATREDSGSGREGKAAARARARRSREQLKDLKELKEDLKELKEEPPAPGQHQK
eukprot:m51a1_g3290 hypothetical protein (184) ;mRNA; r:274857-275452